MVSIIVPVYNSEKVLQRCIESILKQTYTDFELILVNDGSSDNSSVLCEEYAAKDKRIKTIHKKNGGVSSARNVGIDAALGEYLCFVDSDDYISASFLEEILNTAEQYPDCKNIWCGFYTIDSYEFPSKINRLVFTDEEGITFTSVKKIMDLHDKWLDSGSTCKLYFKDVILTNNIRFDEALSLGEDLVFNYMYLDCTNGEITILNKCLYFYTMVNENTLSRKHYDNMFEIYKMLNSIMYDYMKKWNCDSAQYTKFYNACFYKYEVVLKNTFHRDSKIKKKTRYNNNILKTEEFKAALQNCDCEIYQIYRFLYKHSFYFGIRILDGIIYPFVDKG